MKNKVVLIVTAVTILAVVIKLEQGKRLHHQYNWKESILLGANINVSDVSHDIDVYNVFPDDCGCQSMFTIGGCDMNQVIGIQEGQFHASSALSGLSTARLKGTQMFKIWEKLTRYIPKVSKTKTEESIDGDMLQYFNEHPSHPRQSLPFVPCQMHIYTAGDIKTCSKYFQSKWGGPLRIAFVGDSRNRNIMKEMVKIIIEELEENIEGEEIYRSISNFLRGKAKYTFSVKGENIEITFIWAPILDRRSDESVVGYEGHAYGARDIFELWSEGKSWTNNKTNQTFHLPHLVVVNTGMWQSTSQTQTDEALSDFIHSMHIMTPLLIKLATRTRVLWPFGDPTKEYLPYNPAYLKTPAFDLMNNVAWFKLSASKVWLWDTRTVIMLAQKQQCQEIYGDEYKYLPLEWGCYEFLNHVLECLQFYESVYKKNIPLEWGCGDLQHAGQDVEKAALNMILNLACNSLLDMEGDFCCSKI